MNYIIHIDNIMEDLFFELENVQDGDHSHQVVIEAGSEESAADILSRRLRPFFEKNFKKLYEYGDYNDQ